MQAFDGLNDKNNTIPLTTAAVTLAPYVPYVDFAHGGSAYIWPMLERDSCPDGFIQVGQAEHWTNTNVSFYEVNNCYDGSPNQVQYPTAGVNLTHRYVADMAPSGGNFTLAIDVTTVYSGAVDFSYATGAQWDGETDAKDDQMFGGVSAKQTFTDPAECFYAGTYFCGNPIIDHFGSLGTDPAGISYFASSASYSDFTVNDTACAT
jgi:hypothetical protein